MDKSIEDPFAEEVATAAPNLEAWEACPTTEWAWVTQEEVRALMYALLTHLRCLSAHPSVNEIILRNKCLRPTSGRSRQN